MTKKVFNTEKLSITMAAAILDVSTSTLRAWDRSGKLKAQRTENDWRYYSASQIRLFKEGRSK